MKIVKFSLIGLMVGVGVIGCDSSEKRVQDAKVQVDDAKKNLSEVRKDVAVWQNDEWLRYKGEVSERINRNEIRINELRAKAPRSGKTAIETYNQRIAELEQRNNALTSRLTGYKDEGKEKWETFKTDFNREADEFGKALNDFTGK